MLDTGHFQQLGNLSFPAQCHDVQTLAVGTAFLDDLCGDLHTGNAGLGALFVGGQVYALLQLAGSMQQGNSTKTNGSSYKRGERSPKK